MPTRTKKSNQKKVNKHYPIKILGAVVCVAIIVFGGLSIYHIINSSPKKSVDPENPNTAEAYAEIKEDEEGNVEKQDVTDIKDLMDEAAKKPEVKVTENGLKVPVFDLAIRQSNGATIVSGKITNFIEAGGSCTYTISGVTTKSYTVDILPDPKYTVCEALVFKNGDLASGDWQVKVEYKSKTAGGVSETQTFTIQ
jgi:hypothetical protein